MNNRIKTLPADVAARIASGEVIESPLSVVKELLENSLDANATYITVEIKKGGTEYIRVTDNGTGIPADDVELAFTRYGTSKIFEYEDLHKITTLGFRGVALPSIAAVSKIELFTKTSDSRSGVKYTADGGNMPTCVPAACEDGTTIVVRDLFYNTPQRLSFLGSANREASLITDYVSKMAIAYPNVKIRLISNDSILFSTNGKNDLKQAILTVYSQSQAKDLIEVEAQSPEMGMSLSGFVGSPAAGLKSRKYQMFYVNKRWVKSKALENALSEAYHDKLFEGEYPSAYLYLNIDPAYIDVNLLPNKTELRFSDEEAVVTFVANSVRKALISPISMPKAEFKTQEPVYSQLYEKENENITESKLQYVYEYETIQYNTDKDDSFFESLRYESNVSEETEQLTLEEFDNFDNFSFDKLEILSQIFATYILCKDEKHLYIFDQHAAHERIMFESLLRKFNNAQYAVQQLLVPIVIELTPAELLAAKDRLPILEDLGFDIDEFGGSSYAVRAIPASLSDADVETFIKTIFSKDSLGSRDSQLKVNEIISNACKAAVKANDNLSFDEVKSLLNQLQNCENPYNCPHGRPTFLKLSLGDIEHLFKRK